MVNEQMNGDRIEVELGAALSIRLSGPSGTGYEWFVDSLDPALFALMDEEIVPGDPTERMPGGPVTHVFQIKAIQPGEGSIRLSRYRRWEGAGRAVDRFSIHVVVRSGPNL